MNVLGHVDEDGPGASAHGEVEGLFHNTRQVRDVGNEVMMFGDSAADFDHRGFLEGIGADRARGDLAGDAEHRDAVEFRIGDGGDEVGGAGAAGGHDDADLAGAACVTLGGEGASLFVSGQDGADGVAVSREGLVHRHAAATGVGKQNFDAMVDERFDQDIGSVHHSLFGGGGRARSGTHQRILSIQKGEWFSRKAGTLVDLTRIFASLISILTSLLGILAGLTRIGPDGPCPEVEKLPILHHSK